MCHGEWQVRHAVGRFKTARRGFSSKGLSMSFERVLKSETPWHVEVCDVLDGLRTLPDGVIQCCVTSPPYWGLRDYGVEGQLGLEPTPDEYVAGMVAVFREVRRVLRDDGTLWLNIGDSYNNIRNGQCGQSVHNHEARTKPVDRKRGVRCLKEKDLVGIPWMLAFALRADGWYLRSEIIWHKLAPMPESVNDRPTKGHEQVFLLAKSQRYFYDKVASAEPAVCEQPSGNGFKREASLSHQNADGSPRGNDDHWEPADSRNMRSVWTLSPEYFSGAHFATMPTELARRALLSGTSERGGCSVCGAPWRRVTEKNRVATRPGTDSKVLKGNAHPDSPIQRHSGDVCGNRDPERHVTTTKTVGWEPGCKCSFDQTIPSLVLDPFNGAGTTGLVARRLGLRYVGCELNPEYAEMARARIRADQPLFN